MMTHVFTGPPTITIHPTSQLTNISVSVTLDCEGTGRGQITYHWETSNINGGQWMNISNSNNKTLVRNLEQSQQYRCVVSNEAGSNISRVATVTVLSELFISTSTLIIPIFNNRNHHPTSQFYCYSIRRYYIALFNVC